MLSPNISLTRTVQNLLAADTGSLANTDKLKVALILAPFTDEPNLSPSDLTLGTTDGLAPILAGSSTMESYFQPGTLDGVIQIPAPAGGWHWTYTGSTDVTITGIALLTNDLATVFGVEELPDGPVTVSTSGEGFDFGTVALLLPIGTI